MIVYQKTYYERNKAARHANVAAYYSKHKDKRSAKSRSDYVRNIAKRAAKHKAWREANPDRMYVYAVKRKARKLNATPNWANDFFISEAYTLAKQRTEMLGSPWEVDHIVPLQSELVCGLHVENNLRVVQRIENRRKSNSYWPDMP